MNVRLLEPAEQELDEAVAYYNAQVDGLGDAFLWRHCGSWVWSSNIRSRGIPLVAAYGVAV